MTNDLITNDLITDHRSLIIIRNARGVVPAPAAYHSSAGIRDLVKPWKSIVFRCFWLPGPPWTSKLPAETPQWPKTAPKLHQVTPESPNMVQNCSKNGPNLIKNGPKLIKVALITNDQWPDHQWPMTIGQWPDHWSPIREGSGGMREALTISKWHLRNDL